MKVDRVNYPRLPTLTGLGGVGGGAFIPSLDDLTDVDTSGVSPGDTIVWDGAEWVPGTGGGGTTLPWFDIRDYGAVQDGTTDDTAAVQAAIDAAFAAGGGTVYVPPVGITQISGALTNTSTFNSQLNIPLNSSSDPVPIRILGFGPIGTYGGTAPAGQSVIRSDWNGSISGNPAIFSAGKWHDIPSASNVMVTFQDLVIMAHDDPKLSAVQMSCASNVRMINVQIRTATAAPSSLPTHSNAVGYDGPWGLGSTVPDYAVGLDIYGFYTGICAAEQLEALDVGVAFCTRAVLFIGGTGGPTLTHYPVHFSKLVVTLCPRALVFETDIRWVNIDQFAVEHNAGTFAAVYDVDDFNNYAYGFIRYHAVSSTGTLVDILVNNGQNLSYHWGHGKFWRLNSQVQIPVGTDPAGNPPTGFTLYAALATGHPTVRDSAGTVTDLLTGTGPSFATPAIVLGTAAAAGAAATVIRSDATIVAFTSAIPLVESGTGAAGTAAKASREDHVHPAATAVAASDHVHVDDVLMNGDGSTVAFELPAAPFDAYSVQAFVAGVLTEVTLSGTMLTTATFGAAPGSGTNNVRFDIVAVAA